MHFKTILLSILLLLIAGPVCSETSTNLPDVVRKSISENPEVQATWHAFLAASEQQDGARGGYFPRLDLNAGTGWENWDMSDSLDDEFTRSNVALSLRQMVFDGFATRNDVARLGYARLVRYYEVLAAAENVGLEAVRAYLDVLRYRELKNLAVENFVQHRDIFNKVQERAQAGLSRGVDLEQASGRLALAESNLITETTNLYDVSTRYLRIVGQAPAANMIPPELLTEGIPADRDRALRLAFQENPSFNAAVENVRSAEAESKARKAPFMPRVDFQARQNFGRTSSDFQNREDGTIVELVMNYNLFAGGADLAARRQSLQQVSTAKDLREKACRDVRQNLSIAFNDKVVLEQQLRYLNEHQLSAEKTRKAYRDQFDIGQRTLLDLLDTENEYFEARRAYVGTSYDYALAHARTLASMGRLLSNLQVSREALPSLDEIGQDRFGIDPDAICPAETIETTIEFPPLPAPVAIKKSDAPPRSETDNDADGDGVPNYLDACPDTPAGTTVDKFGCPEALPGRVSFKVNVLFPFASAKLPASYADEIFRLAEFLQKHPDLKLTIEGHTDSVGSSQFNQRLSQQRADSVVKNLVEKHGIPPERLMASGFGEDRPIADNTTAEGRSQNRRVVAVTAKNHD
jgi:adhesin transport system outer membrane protein